MKFIVHDAVGRILRTGNCPDDHLDLQAQDGETVIEGEADDAKSRIENGEVVLLPSKPSVLHQFDYELKQWVDPRTMQDHVAATRARRDTLLLACDWTQLPDVPLATKQAWATYRQSLRDITQQADPLAIEWPTPP